MPISFTAHGKSPDVGKTSSSTCFVKVQSAATNFQRLVWSVAIRALQLFIVFYCKVKKGIFERTTDLNGKKTEGIEKPLLDPQVPKSDAISKQRDEISSGQSIPTVLTSQSSSSLESVSSDEALSSEKSKPSDLSKSDRQEIDRLNVLQNPAKEVRKAQLFNAAQAAFASFFPLKCTTVETFGTLKDALEQLKKDIPRARISIGGHKIETLDQFEQTLKTTPFAQKGRQLAELLSQAAMAPTTYEIFTRANDHYLDCIKDSDGLLLLADQYGPLKVDLHRSDLNPDVWVVEGSIDLHLSLNHPLFADDEGFRSIVDRLCLHYAVDLPKELAQQDQWAVTFNHSAFARKSAE